MNSFGDPSSELMQMTLHPRTLRNAREQVRLMVHDGLSTQKIKRYLLQWTSWWVRISETWSYQKILQLFFDHCWDIQISAIAMAVMQHICVTSHNRTGIAQVTAQAQGLA